MFEGLEQPCERATLLSKPHKTEGKIEEDLRGVVEEHSTGAGLASTATALPNHPCVASPSYCNLTLEAFEACKL